MSADQVVPTVALIGSPNSGKTTLFNWLTGSKFKTVNYAGSTVDCYKGASLAVYGSPLSILDTPGVYSLQPHGRDEEITLEALTHSDAVKAVVVVVDGTQLNRQLYLVRQVQELGLPMVVAVTMMDIVKKWRSCSNAQSWRWMGGSAGEFRIWLRPRASSPLSRSRGPCAKFTGKM